MTAPTPARPADRYGPPARRRTRALVVAAGLVILALVAVAAWQVGRWDDTAARAGVVGWGPTVDGRIEVVVDVRRPPGTAARCEVRAIDRRRAVVGTGYAEVPAQGPDQVRVTVTVAVELEAITAEAGACTTP